MKRSLLPAIGIALVALVLAPGRSHAQLFSLTKEQMVEFTAQNPFERFPDGRPKVPDGLIERVRGLSAEEVLAVLPGKMFRNQYADGFRVLHPGKRLAGRAFTVQFMPVRPDLDTVVQARAKTAGLGRMYNQAAIDMLQPGDVLVVDLFGQEEGGTIVGDNLFYYIMKATKGAGLVVDGAIRDLEGIQNMDMPAYFRAAHPSAISNVMITGINVPVRIGKATVMPGDLVFGDAEGVYFIPPALVRTGRGQRRRDPHPRRVDAHEVRRRKIQVQRNLRHAEGSGAAEGIPGVPQEAARGDSQEESQVALAEHLYEEARIPLCRRPGLDRHRLAAGPARWRFARRRLQDGRSRVGLGRDRAVVRAASLHVPRNAAARRTKFAGTAVTVQLKREEHKEGSAASQGMLDAIDAAPPGSVYVMVLDNGAGPGTNSWSNAGIDYAGIGGLMATAMKYRGFAGAVIDASVRDTPQIRKLQFPVFSRGVAPSTTINHFRVTGVNVPVTCAGVQVNPGDIITADEDGVAVVPAARAAEILKKSQELDDTEHRMIPFIEKFKSIKEAVKQFGRI